MDKTYDPQAIETRWYAFWESRGLFAPRGGPEARPYCIMIPPPNVTGTLHMGHAFQHTLMDALIRYHRMLGDRTLWQPGTDHAGIATQMVVERQLEAEGIRRQDLGREAFLARVWEWKERSGGTIARQMRRLGDSPDWSRERFTMDEGLSRAVIEVFVRLYEEGLIYRGQRLVNWDPVLRTAISDLEVVPSEEDGRLWHIRYPLVDRRAGDPQYLVVATTRPETLLGDTAVAVHPDDPRYAALVGREVELPLTGRRIPVIADAYVDPEFGSGCVKITPAHDFNDYEVGRRHGLPLINVLTADAKINDNAPPAYRGLDRYEARSRVVADLEAKGLVERVESHRMTVPRGDRSGAVIEPFLTDQWFVRTAPLAEPAIRAVEQGRIRFVPENWAKTYFNWMHNIQDWCISRQLWWGHRIPAWYDPEGRVFVARSEAEARAKYELPADLPLSQDEDVLDTWFSSALWPFSTLGWPERTEELAVFYPTSVLVTGFDIIFFWVARMIMMGLKFMGDVPFREVYITGLIRDEHGQKMSKSKGNILDPLDLMDGIDLEALVAKRTTGLMQPELAPKIEAATRKRFPQGIPGYGADALRFTLASLASTGRDIRFDIKRMEGYRNFCNKLWNAARYVLLSSEGKDTGLDPEAPVALSVADRWIVSRLQRLEAALHQHFAEYRFDLAAQALHSFVWDEYCDWYLELSKTVLQDARADDAALRGTRRTLVRVLEAVLRAAHPIIPFITEELWQHVAPLAGRRGETIMLQPYPRPEPDKIDEAAEAEIDWLKRLVVEARRLRAELGLPPGRPLPLYLHGGDETDRRRSAAHAEAIRRLARLERLEWLEGDIPAQSATAPLGELTIVVPLAGLIDLDAERERLHKALSEHRAALARIERKLADPKFLERAPGHVVEQQRARREEHQAALATLQRQAQRLGLALDTGGA
ncbi:MAG: valine--tRNA ligase [Gammaproteobacteria bacterium]|nr:MAG: valine--tRNA ligase [Gammaproteobacteria bacterium]